MKRAPAHAGSMRLPERLAFVVVFTVMATFVVGLSVLAAKSGARALTGRPLAGASLTQQPAQGGQQQEQHPVGTRHRKAGERAGTQPAQPSAVLSKRLTAALSATLGTDRAHLSVGVVDTATGAEALYQASEHYHAVSIVGADILAALLYQHQQARTPIGKQEASLAAEMIENSSGAAATRLWQAIGRGAGLAAANRALRLQHTIPGMADAWGLTRTTVADQLQLLSDLATTRSALGSADRHYELRLMAGAATAERWGVPAAAGVGTSCALSDVWQPGAHRSVVDSIGVIDHGGHEFLVVIFSRDWPTSAAGISAVQLAAVAAVRAMPASS